MKTTSKMTLSLAVAFGIFFSGCNDNVQAADTKVAKPSISEESLGLRKTNLYAEESETAGAETKYGKSYAGSGYKINRAFQDAPPMIPHDVEGMLPITIKNNACVGCHAPAVASSMGATPYPTSHMTNFRPSSSYAIQGQNTSSESLAHISIKKENRLVGARFNCSQCHAPQSQGKLAVENTFEAVFSDKDGATKSSWVGSRLTDDLDTTK